MTKKELLEKLNIIQQQGLNTSVNVGEMIVLISALQDEKPMEATLDTSLIADIVSNVLDQINSEGERIIDDYDLELNGREIEITSICLDDSRIENAVRAGIEESIEYWNENHVSVYGE